MSAATNSNSTVQHDNRIRIENAVASRLGDSWLSNMIATELTTLFYLCRLPTSDSSSLTEAPDKATTFTYHRNSGMTAMLLVIIPIMVVEIVAIHLLLMRISHVLAWLASLSTVYVAGIVIAQVRAIRCRPVFLDVARLHIRNGMFNLAVIPIDAIESVEVTGRDIDSEPDDKPLNCSVPVSHNVVLRLNVKTEATLLYGQKRMFSTALLCLDEPAEFADAVSGDGV